MIRFSLFNSNPLAQHSTITQDPLLSYFHSYDPADKSAKSFQKEVILSSLGDGAVCCFGVEEGFCAGFYDICLFDDTTFSYPSKINSIPNTLFRMTFSLSARASDDSFYAPHFLTNNSISIYAINFGRLGFLPKDKHYKSLEFIFSREWLMKNYSSSSDQLLKLVQFFTIKKDPALLSELLDQSTLEKANVIATGLCKEATSFLRLKAQIFNFMDFFFQKALQRSEICVKKKHALKYTIISEVEKSLSRYYSEELPNICILAKEFNISSSTLKRQFRLIFKKNIYSYYLEQKMAIGMAMLEEKNASVSEIAYRLGYQKINSFSKIFKKHYGILPSQLHTVG
jgi:AraC-like DNA-binding protein